MFVNAGVDDAAELFIFQRCAIVFDEPAEFVQQEVVAFDTIVEVCKWELRHQGLHQSKPHVGFWRIDVFDLYLNRFAWLQFVCSRHLSAKIISSSSIPLSRPSRSRTCLVFFVARQIFQQPVIRGPFFYRPGLLFCGFRCARI